MTWTAAREDEYGRRLERALLALEDGQEVDVGRVFGGDSGFLERGATDLRLLMRLGLGPRGRDGVRGSGGGGLGEGELVAERYEVLQPLGVGGYCEVWLAADRRLGRLVALKAPRADLPREAQGRLRDSILRDGRSLASVRHPNIVHVNDVFDSDGRPFLCLEYVRGESLASVVKFGALHWSDGLRYVADVGEALEAVHRAGLVHRDVKPHNILWDSSTDEVKLTDFGLAVACGETTGPAGTPLFMAPEAFEGASDAPVDVYSLAATLFTLLSGEPPFPGKSVREVQSLQRTGLASDDRWDDVPAACREVIAASLAYDGGSRPSLAELVSSCRGALNQNLAPAPTTWAPPPGLSVHVSRLDESRAWTAIAESGAALPTSRDIAPVASYRIVTGDRVRVDVHCAQDGYLAVLAIGPTGRLHLLYPRNGTEWARVGTGDTVTVADLEVVPPTGRERISVLWCRYPRPADLADLRALSGSEAVSPEHRATRDIVHLQDTLGLLAKEDWSVASVEIDHREPG